MNSNIQIVVNGESREIRQGSGIPALLLQLGLPNDRVAIERNLEILPRSQWPTTTVQQGDRYEIVHLVGGG
ncbi:MAG TPA: sulfur carrier protein ThiS [Candidatus Acidoferrales bacterium]|jgi:thiamine biosynthesis protein ThiS|nr:sulfur carrier protein ThiS [Candidatus Acidoferrales bacterium]